jgi:hypothetical protein
MLAKGAFAELRCVVVVKVRSPKAAVIKVIIPAISIADRFRLRKGIKGVFLLVVLLLPISLLLTNSILSFIYIKH